MFNSILFWSLQMWYIVKLIQNLNEKRNKPLQTHSVSSPLSINMTRALHLFACIWTCLIPCLMNSSLYNCVCAFNSSSSLFFYPLKYFLKDKCLFWIQQCLFHNSHVSIIYPFSEYLRSFSTTIQLPLFVNNSILLCFCTHQNF